MHDGPISDAVFDKLHQPRVIESIEIRNSNFQSHTQLSLLPSQLAVIKIAKAHTRFCGSTLLSVIPLVRQENFKEAISHFFKALKIKSSFKEIKCNLKLSTTNW